LSGRLARVTARNGEHGYGWVTKLMHWATVVVLATQFAVGWSLSDDAYDARADALEERWENRVEITIDERSEEEAEAELERRLDALEEREDEFVTAAFEDVVALRFLGDGVTSAEVHVVLGLLVLALGLVRLAWRSLTPLPPWAEHLSASERRWESGLEKLVLAMLLVVPCTGLLLVLGEEDWLPVHVTAQVFLLAGVALHVGLVLRHTVVRRDRHLARML
jgi:cytochrome b561